MTSQMKKRKRRPIPKNTTPPHPSPLDPSITHSSQRNFEDDENVMFIEIIKKYDDSHEEELEVEVNAMTEGLGVEYFDTFPTRSELAYHNLLEEGITRSVFGVKEIDMGEEEAPYWTTLGKKESYKPQTSSDGIGAQTPYYARKELMDCHLLGEWEMARDAEINPFKDVLVFRQMVEFLGALPINLMGNMWESEDLIEKPINWNKPPKDGDGAWHAKIKIIDPDGEEFTKTFQ
ncbi:hypothetical protein Tco_0500127 [Tanacetum coccineum]